MDRYTIASMAVLLHRASFLRQHPTAMAEVDQAVAVAFMLTLKMVG